MKAIFDAEYRQLLKSLKKARLSQGISQKALAKKLGYTQSYISKIEQGQIRLDIIQLKRISKSLNKDLSNFLK